MLAIETLLSVAVVGGVGALLTALVTSVAGGWSSRKSKADRKATGVELAQRVLTETIAWQDGEIADLRTEIRTLKTRIRRLENNQQRGDP